LTGPIWTTAYWYVFDAVSLLKYIHYWAHVFILSL